MGLDIPTREEGSEREKGNQVGAWIILPGVGVPRGEMPGKEKNHAECVQEAWQGVAGRRVMPALSIPAEVHSDEGRRQPQGLAAVDV